MQKITFNSCKWPGSCQSGTLTSSAFACLASSRSRSLGSVGMPNLSRPIIIPWSGHYYKETRNNSRWYKLVYTNFVLLLEQVKQTKASVTSQELTFLRSIRGHNLPLGKAARQAHFAGPLRMDFDEDGTTSFTTSIFTSWKFGLKYEFNFNLAIN